MDTAASDENANPNPTISGPNVDKMSECDYDTNPSALYSLIQNKKWEKAIARARESTVDCATWVFRKEGDGKLRWRLLPIHAAIIFKAPEDVVEELLLVYPTASQCKDDQEMLPLHLALRNGSSEVIINLLLMSFPASVEVKDRKGRVPLGLAQISSSPLRDTYVECLKNARRYYKVAAASSADEQQARDSNVVSKHAAEAEKLNLVSKINSLESELMKSKERSSALVEHANTIEAQLNSRGDTERFLASKIANLDKAVKAAVEEKELVIAQEMAKTEQMKAEKTEVEEKIAALEKEKEDLKVQNEEQSNALNSKQKGTDMWEDQIKLLEAERASALANAAVMEAQLKKKIKTEHFLASQVKDLAGQLADSAALSSDTTNNYVKRIDKLTMENSDLKNTIALLTMKLKEVLKTLDNMADEQIRIIGIASKHEATIAKIVDSQERVLIESQNRERFIDKMKMEREALMNILTKQIDDIQIEVVEKKIMQSKIDEQEAMVEEAMKEREALKDSINNLNGPMDQLKDTIQDIYEEADKTRSGLASEEDNQFNLDGTPSGDVLSTEHLVREAQDIAASATLSKSASQEFATPIVVESTSVPESTSIEESTSVLEPAVVPEESSLPEGTSTE